MRACLGYEGNGKAAMLKADILGRAVDFRIGAPGRHIAQNAVGALLAVAMLEGDVLNAAAALRTSSRRSKAAARASIRRWH